MIDKNKFTQNAPCYHVVIINTLKEWIFWGEQNEGGSRLHEARQSQALHPRGGNPTCHLLRVFQYPRRQRLGTPFSVVRLQNKTQSFDKTFSGTHNCSVPDVEVYARFEVLFLRQNRENRVPERVPLQEPQRCRIKNRVFVAPRQNIKISGDYSLK